MTQRKVILAVTWGNILEWYEVYSYAYLAPVLSQQFFDSGFSLHGLFGVFLIFGAGFVMRPLGALLFGRIGDLLGRRTAFIGSIVTMTVPTFLMGCLPTYQAIGAAAPILLGVLRALQSVPAAGEMPGAACFLYEYARPGEKRFMASWTGVGNQLGAIVGIVEVLIFECCVSEEFLFSWGWRISFWGAGVIGLLGLYLRSRLHETPMFRDMKAHPDGREQALRSVVRIKGRIGRGIAFGAVNAATFYLIATFIPSFLQKTLQLGMYESALVLLAILLLITVLLPIFGWIGDRVNNRALLVASSLLIIALLLPLYQAIQAGDGRMLLAVGCLYIFPVSCLSAILAYSILHLFSTSVRFTGSALSFNISDGVIGGFTPALAVLLWDRTGDQGAFVWIILVCALISLWSYASMKE